jgi:hypothetical protein
MTTRTPFASKSAPALQPAAYGWASLAGVRGGGVLSGRDSGHRRSSGGRGGAVDGGKTVRSDAEEEGGSRAA